ncbi:hypothetical protein ES288_D02G065900v1 [Gossypium darwinii]|uniref:Flowering-promoting factor 1 n=2 Tax=Gossypium TaxID=3633 RepID=A0A0D2SBL5_GOSRA|nr:hypothetical protein B456_005G059900 [Gossypium raimondii]TYG78527.1 hypothetical protein ES288_D02G065900v1 [Gossypium darwinii]
MTKYYQSTNPDTKTCIKNNTPTKRSIKNNDVVRLVENSGSDQRPNPEGKLLVHTPSNEVTTSYEILETKLLSLGWERYYGSDPDLFQFHKRSSIHLISLPKEFTKFKSVYMYDIVVKNPNMFMVMDK